MTISIPLYTDRLQLRPFTHNDTTVMSAIYGDAEVMRYVGDGRAVDPDEGAAMVDKYRVHQSRYGLAFWAISERASGEIMGDAGFEFRVNNDGNDVTCEFGVTLGRKWWGNGYAYEAGQCCLAAAFGAFGLPSVTAFVDIENAASVRLIEKLGFTRLEICTDYDRPHYEFLLTSDTWKARTGRECAPTKHPITASSSGVARLLLLHNHPDEEVRKELAIALPALIDYQPRKEVVEVLVQLSTDIYDDVRDWACFGLGQLTADSPDVRSALYARLSDAHVDTRHEALVALARIGDERIIPILEKQLEEQDIWTLQVVAASLVADPHLYPMLEEIAQTWEDEGDKNIIELALHRCDPSARQRAMQFESLLLKRLHACYVDCSTDVEIQGVYPRTQLVVTENRVQLEKWSIWDDEDPLAELDIDQHVEHWRYNIGLIRQEFAE